MLRIPKTKKMADAPILIAFSGSLAPSNFPAMIASPSEITIPIVEPIQTGRNGCVEARVMVESMVLSPISAMKNVEKTSQKG